MCLSKSTACYIWFEWVSKLFIERKENVLFVVSYFPDQTMILLGENHIFIIFYVTYREHLLFVNLPKIARKTPLVLDKSENFLLWSLYSIHPFILYSLYCIKNIQVKRDESSTLIRNTARHKTIWDSVIWCE